MFRKLNNSNHPSLLKSNEGLCNLHVEIGFLKFSAIFTKIKVTAFFNDRIRL